MADVSARLFSLLTEEATRVPWWKIDDLRVRKSQPIPLHNPHSRSLGLRDPLCVYKLLSGLDSIRLGSLVSHCPWFGLDPLFTPYTRFTLTDASPPNYGGLLHSLLFVLIYSFVTVDYVLILFQGGCHD